MLRIYIQLQENNSFFISDNFYAWFKNDGQKEYSKPMFFDPDNKKFQLIFFDDNIENKPTSIVDCKKQLKEKLWNIKI